MDFIYLVDIYHFTTFADFMKYCDTLQYNDNGDIINMYGKKIIGDCNKICATINAFSTKKIYKKADIESICRLLGISEQSEKEYVYLLWRHHESVQNGKTKSQKELKLQIKKYNRLPQILRYDQSFRQFLGDYIRAKRVYCKSFSNRHICRLLSPTSTNATAITDILQKKKNITDKRRDQFINNVFYFSEIEKEYCKILIDYEQSDDRDIKQKRYSDLTKIRENSSDVTIDVQAGETFDSKVYYPVIKSLFDIHLFKENDYISIYEAIPLSIRHYIDEEAIQKSTINSEKKKYEIIKRTVEYLLSQELIAVKDRYYYTVAEVVLGRQTKNFEKVLRQLAFEYENVKGKNGFVAPCMLTLSSEGFNKIKKRTQEYQKDIITIVQEDSDEMDKREIYSLLLQLFPLN